jgi:hypothetical protein
MHPHPWIWINEPQHGTAIQALAAVVATIAAVIAGYFAARAYFATSTQLTIAREQLKLQKDQFQAERDRLEEEKKSERARALMIYENKVAVEEARRPKFRITGTTGEAVQRLGFTNYSVTAATDVTFGSVTGKTKAQRMDIVRPTFDAIVTTDLEEFRSVGIPVSFRTEYGSFWCVRLKFLNNSVVEEVISVDRIYASDL